MKICELYFTFVNANSETTFEVHHDNDVPVFGTFLELDEKWLLQEVYQFRYYQDLNLLTVLLKKGELI